jgi:hypothetical protein
MDKECQNVRRRLALVRPEDPLEAELEAHLSSCVSCRLIRQGDLATWGLLELYTAPPTPSDLWIRVNEALSHGRTPRRRETLGKWMEAFCSAWRLAPAIAFTVALGLGLGGRLGSALTIPYLVPSTPRTTTYAQDEWGAFDLAPPGSLARAYLSPMADEP